MYKILIFTFFLFQTLSGTFAQRTGNFKNKPPKVVIGILVENMRPDYIDRYWEKFQTGGFKKLYSEGTVCSNFNSNQHVLNYATGTATLFTGVYPSSHGIVDEIWYDRLREKEVRCISDDNYFTVGADSKSGNVSPAKLKITTVGDILKLNSMGKARVFSVAMNDVSAIFSAGHSADGAYWFDTESGRIISSSFYINFLPEWVRKFNESPVGEKYTYRNWVLLNDENSYTESLADAFPLEKGYGPDLNTFPHSISKLVKDTRSYAPLKTTPYANTIIKDFALELLNNEPIGTDNITDLVTMVFSSMDYENIAFGPASLEMEDLYLRLDQDIAGIIDFAEKKYGRENVIFFLSSNTSASYPATYLKEKFKMPVDNFMPESALALLNSYLNLTFGEKKWIEHISGQQLYLDHKLIEKNKISLVDIRDKIADFLTQFGGIKVALTAHQLEQSFSVNGALANVQKTYMINRSGDVLYVLNEGWQPIHKFKKINYTDQTHLPLVFYGAGIQAGTNRSTIEVIDFAPTLCELMQIPHPDKGRGNIINLIQRER